MNGQVVERIISNIINKQMCESCLMPLAKDPMGEGRESPIYCSYCYRDGKLVYEGDDPKEFRKQMYHAVRGRGVNAVMAWFYTFMTRFAPRWKGKR